MSLLIVKEGDYAAYARPSRIGEKRGWCFEVVYGKRSYPQVVSALYKTKSEAEDALQAYIETGKLESWGSAE